MQKQIVILVLGFTLTLSSLNSTQAAAFDWPQWRGPDRTDVSKETGLLKEWPATGPKRLWLYEQAGLGYAGFSLADGKLYTMGARAQTEYLIALDAATGKELWTSEIGPMMGNDRGDGPRGTPTVDGDRVYALGGKGALICAAAKDGRQLWKAAMSDFGGKLPNWGYAESPLVDGTKVICTPGESQGAIVALDKLTGKLIWQSKEFTDGAQYTSPIVAEVNKTRQYIQLTMQHVVGISPADGKVLWQSPWPGKTAVIPTPIYHDGQVYVTSGYGVGRKLVKIGSDNAVSDGYENKVMKNHHGGVILVGDHVYGHSDGSGWICQNFKTGEEVWNDNKEKLGKGAIAYADGMFYCLEETSGTVVLIEATTAGWKEHGRFKLDPQTKQRSPKGKVWTHPVISNGRLYLRDQELVFCYDVKKR